MPDQPSRLTAAEFEALCAALWPDGWQRRAAEHLGVLLRNVQFWAAEPPATTKPVPINVRAELLAEYARRMADPVEAARLRDYVRRQRAAATTVRAAMDQGV